jgi:hypothetical protein
MITGRSGRPILSVRWCAPLLGITRVPCRVTEWCARPVVRIGVGLEKERRSDSVSECEVNRKVQGRCSSKLRVRESRSWGSRAAGGNSASLLPFVARLSYSTSPQHQPLSENAKDMAVPLPPQWVVDLNAPPTTKPKTSTIPDPPGYTAPTTVTTSKVRPSTFYRPLPN